MEPIIPEFRSFSLWLFGPANWDAVRREFGGSRPHVLRNENELTCTYSSTRLQAQQLFA